MWPINPNVLRARLDPERVKKAVIVVRNAVALVNSDVDLTVTLVILSRNWYGGPGRRAMTLAVVENPVRFAERLRWFAVAVGKDLFLGISAGFRSQQRLCHL